MAKEHEGPGRPAKPEKAVRVTLFLRPDVARKLAAWAEAEGIERSTKAVQLVTRAVARRERRQGESQPADV